MICLLVSMVWSIFVFIIVVAKSLLHSTSITVLLLSVFV